MWTNCLMRSHVAGLLHCCWLMCTWMASTYRVVLQFFSIHFAQFSNEFAHFQTELTHFSYDFTHYPFHFIHVSGLPFSCVQFLATGHNMTPMLFACILTQVIRLEWLAQVIWWVSLIVVMMSSRCRVIRSYIDNNVDDVAQLLRLPSPMAQVSLTQVLLVTVCNCLWLSAIACDCL